MAIVDDKRDVQDRPVAWVIATDSFLSGWGYAPNRSLFAVACHNEDEIGTVETNMRLRGDMKRPRIVTKMRRDGQPAIKLYEGDHLSLRDHASARAFFRSRAFAE